MRPIGEVGESLAGVAWVKRKRARWGGRNLEVQNVLF